MDNVTKELDHISEQLKKIGDDRIVPKVEYHRDGDLISIRLVTTEQELKNE